MITVRNRVTLSIALAIALAVTPAIAGCSVVKGVIEQGTGGKVDLGGKSIPASFPTADVPLISGEVVYGAGVTADSGDVWNITINSTDANAFQTITGQLTGAGFTSQTGTAGSGDSGSTGAFTGGKYSVVVVVSKGGDANTYVVNYTVTATTEK